LFARRHDLDPVCSIPHIEEAIALARRLADSPEDEPPAIFFAFVRARVAFPGALVAMTRQLAANCARSNGMHLRATSNDAGTLVAAIGRGEAQWLDVRRWFHDRLGT
jgi:hypothetical protein